MSKDGQFELLVEWSYRMTSSMGRCSGKTINERRNYKITLNARSIAELPASHRHRELAIKAALIHELAHVWADYLHKSKGHDSHFHRVLVLVGHPEVARPFRNPAGASNAANELAEDNKIRRHDFVSFTHKGRPLVARVLKTGAKNAIIYRPGLQVSIPLARLAKVSGPPVQRPWLGMQPGDPVLFLDGGKKEARGSIVGWSETHVGVRSSGELQEVPYGRLV